MSFFFTIYWLQKSAWKNAWERNINFVRKKKILNLCLKWYILRSYHFVAEVTFKRLQLYENDYCSRYFVVVFSFLKASLLNAFWCLLQSYFQNVLYILKSMFTSKVFKLKNYFTFIVELVPYGNQGQVVSGENQSTDFHMYDH